MAKCFRSFIVLCLALMLISALAYAQTPAEVMADAVATSGAFPAGTTVVGVAVDGGSIVVDLSLEAVGEGFGDTQSDGYTDALFAAVSAWPEINSISITVGGVDVAKFLPASTLPDFAPTGGGLGTQSIDGGLSTMAAQDPLLPPSVPALGSELAGKLIVLGPSHGAYVYGTPPSVWYRAMRTLSGPQPQNPLWPSSYQPSDYYYYTRGFTWPRYYEDDMSPELVRYLYAYCQAAGATTFLNRNLDKTAGDFDAVGYGYPAAPFQLPKWLTASKYALEDRGGIPEAVWNDPGQSTESNKDIRARANYVNWLMQTLGYNHNNTIYVAWHSNAATACGTQAQARGTETFNSLANTTWKTEQARSPAFSSTTCAAIISAIRNYYDGYWANDVYNKNVSPIPPEWCTSYGTYRGYRHEGPSTPSSTDGWQNRGPKAGNYGEIRETKCPSTLVELVFHDQWKFYPDQAFHQDNIFKATVTWGVYEGFCTFFGVTPRARLNASVDSTSFPTGFVGPGAAINGTVVMKNLGQAWCWGNKQVDTSYVPYTVWELESTAADQFAAGTKLEIADDGIYYPGDTATFGVSLTAPSASGIYTTAWRMLKDDARGGSFGDTATAQIQVDADPPVVVIPIAGDYQYGAFTVLFSATDELSGIASVVGDVDGVAVTNGQVIYPALGSHTLTVVATDNVGNTITQSVTFNVVNTVGKTTAGGWIELASKKASCGFVSEYIEGASAPSGNVTYQDHDYSMTVKSTGLIAMGIVGNHAWILGNCTIEGEPGHWFRIDVIDNGEPGDTDVFSILLDTGYTQGGTLGGGNVTIH